MYFMVEDDKLLEKCNTIWDKVSVDIKKRIDCKPVYNQNYLKTKIKLHGWWGIAIRLMFFKKAILRKEIWKYIFWKSNIERVTLKMYFLREQF